MRHTMGWRIDGLSDQQRDRLITAHDMNDGALWWNQGAEPPCGCLEGTITQGQPYPYGEVMDLHIEALELSPTGDQDDVPWHLAPPSVRYPQAVKRFGKERVIRAIKARAAKPYRVQSTVVESPVMETVDG